MLNTRCVILWCIFLLTGSLLYYSLSQVTSVASMLTLNASLRMNEPNSHHDLEQVTFSCTGTLIFPLITVGLSFLSLHHILFFSLSAHALLISWAVGSLIIKLFLLPLITLLYGCGTIYSSPCSFINHVFYLMMDQVLAFKSFFPLFHSISTRSSLLYGFNFLFERQWPNHLGEKV